MIPAGTRVSDISQSSKNLSGLYVEVNVPKVRDNTKDDHFHQGEFGVIPGDQDFGFVPIEVNLESGERKLFWRHSLVVRDSFTCIECQGRFPGVDYLCDECRLDSG